MFKQYLTRQRFPAAGAIGIALASLAGATPALAHHAFGAEFDPNRPLVLRGPVVRVEWVNPHTWIHMEVTRDDGSKEIWMVEGGTPNTLLRNGLSRESLTPFSLTNSTSSRLRFKMRLVTKGSGRCCRCFIINSLINTGHNAISHQLLDNIYRTNLQ